MSKPKPELYVHCGVDSPTIHWRFGMTILPGPDALLASSANVDQTSCARSWGRLTRKAPEMEKLHTIQSKDTNCQEHAHT